MRLRQSINVAGDACGRWAAHKSFLGTGTPLQTLPPRLRGLLRADPSHDFWTFTLRHADLWTVAQECDQLGDPQLLADLRDGVELEALPILAVAYGQGDVSLSETWLERSWRSGGPLLVVTAATCKRLMATAISRYPGLRRRTDRVRMLLQTTGTLTAASGLVRTFFGAKRDDATLKEALAFSPRANTAHAANVALLAAVRDGVTPFGVTYDDPVGEASLLGQASVALRDTLPAKASAWLPTPPLEAVWGASWADAKVVP
jgi:hypothetical protein